MLFFQCRLSEKIEDKELGMLLDEDPCKTQDELAELLGVDLSTISRRLHALGIVFKLLV